MKKLYIILYVFLLMIPLAFASVPYPEGPNQFTALRIFHSDSVAGTTLVDALGTEDGALFNTEDGDWISSMVGFGNAIRMDTVNEYGDLRYGAELSVYDAWTVCFWLNTTQAGAQQYFLGLRDVGNKEFFIASWDATTMYDSLKGSNGVSFFSDTPNYNNGLAQHHCITVRTGAGTETQGRIQHYFNGANVTRTVNDNGAIATDNALVDIFLNGINPVSNYAGGTYDDILIFNYELSQSQVNTIYLGNYSALPPAINVTIDYPPNNYGFNLSTLTEIGFKLWVNVSTNISDSSCSINDTSFTKQSAFTFLNNTLLPDGAYNIYVNCSNTSQSLSNGSDTVRFTIDTNSPVITPAFKLRNNDTVVYNGTLSTHINFSDNLEIYSLNITFGNGTSIYNRTNVGNTTYNLTIHLGVNSDVLGNITARVCDAHTLAVIDKIDKVEIDKNGLKYVIEDKPLFAQDDFIAVYPKDITAYETPATEKEKDRYSFTFNKKSPPSTTETFIVESNHVIDVPKLQSYGGHLVIKDLGKNGYWIDFNNKEATKYSIQRISDTKIEVTVTGLKSSAMAFNSIGELNCITETFYFLNLNPITSYTPFVLSGVSTNIRLNVSTSNVIINTINATLSYNGTNYYAGNTPNFTQALTPVISEVSKNLTFNWTVNVNGYDYLLDTYQQNVSNIFLDNCSNYTAIALNVTFKDITTLAPSFVNLTTTALGDFDFSNTMQNISEATFCIWPEYATINDSIQLQYTIAGFSFYYNANYSLTNTTQYLTIYTQSATDTTTFTVYDKLTLETIENALITIYRLVAGIWTPTEAKYTDITGKTEFNYVQDVNYKFIINKDGYISKEFNLNPILFSTYDIYLDINVTTRGSLQTDRIKITYSPQLFYDAQLNTFTFRITAPYSDLDYYGFTVRYPGGSNTSQGTNESGQYFSTSFTIVNARVTDTLNLSYWYYTDSTGFLNYSTTYTIVVAPTNYSMIHNRDEKYGLGIIERVLIATAIVVLVVGIATLVGQLIPGMALGVFVFGYLTYIGFIPFWSIALPCIIIIMLLAFRPGET